MRKKHWTVTPWFLIFASAMLIMALASYNYNHTLCYIELAMAVLSFAVVFISSLHFHNYIVTTVRNAANRIRGVDSEYLERYKSGSRSRRKKRHSMVQL